MESKPLLGKVALVTGAAGGMGLGYALHLARLGANVAAVDKDLGAGKRRGEIAADSVAKEVRAAGTEAIEVEVDLARREGADEAIKRTVAKFGRLDILINNAGGAITPAERSTATLAPDDDIETLIGANLMSTIYCCQAAAPVLTRPGGVIINISSIGTQLCDAQGRYAIYAAAKSAVVTYTRHLAAELGPLGIRANCIAPGLIATPRVALAAAQRGLATPAQAEVNPLRRLGRVEDLLGAMEFLATDMSAYVTGECITVSGGQALVAA